MLKDESSIDLAEIDIRVEKRTLIVKGQRDIVPRNEQSSYHRIERTYS